MEDFKLAVNSPAALKHLSAFGEDGGNVFRQFFNLLGIFGWLQKHHFFLDTIQNIWGLNVS